MKTGATKITKETSGPTAGLWDELAYKNRKVGLFRLWKFLVHPVVVFTLLQITMIAAIVSWIVFYLNIQEQFTQSFKAFGISREFLADQTGIIAMGLGIAFLSLILVGSILLFVFAIKQAMLNRQQKQFLSSVTHELKSPLSSLQLCLETLQNRPLNAQQSGKLLHMMQKDSWRLIRLVDQILVSSRLERGIDPDEIWVLQPPQKFLENILSEMNQNLDDKSRFVLNCKVQEDIYLWERPLKMVIVNLLENALKYSPIHSPIELSLEQVGGFYLLQVKDQGFGVPKPEQKKIFRMFQRGMHSNENAIPGTGLGLFIAYNVVKSMKGRIWVESEGLNRGSTFLMKWKKRTLPQSHAKKS